MTTQTKARATKVAILAQDERPPYLTARNPRALAEIVLGRPIDWDSLEDPNGLLEEVLVTPRERLFDPRFDSPVYLGFRLGKAGEVVETPLPEPEDLPVPEQDDSLRLPQEIGSLKDLVAVLGDLDEAAVRRIAPARAGGWTIELAPGGRRARQLRAAIFDRSVLERLVRIIDIDFGWTPDGAQWVDTGRFYDEAAEFFDPVQGALGDCWLIAAMASVAWALPGQIADASRASGTTNDRFLHRFVYRDPGTGTQRTFEVSDETLVHQGTTSQLYARSSEAGEIWPGVVEKAFAQWRQDTTHDHPNLTVLNGGDPVWASAALSGRTPQYFGHGGQTAVSLATLVKSHSLSYRTFDPMTAWTYDTAPDGLSYSDANIVGNHAYSVLGWTTGTILVRAFESLLARSTGTVRERLLGEASFLLDPIVLTRDYVVLRNPWGFHEGTAGARHGVISMRDAGFWRAIDLDVVDGVFAVDFSTYQRYFAGTGVAV
jgi:hypothetical protein